MDKFKVSKESELRFASEFLRAGYIVYQPYLSNISTDLLIEKEGSFYRVQIKASKPQNGVIKLKLRSTNNWSNKKYSAKDVDYLGLYDYENKTGYLVPLKEFDGNSIVHFRINSTKNKQIKGINKASEYLYFK